MSESHTFIFNYFSINASFFVHSPRLSVLTNNHFQQKLLRTKLQVKTQDKTNTMYLHATVLHYLANTVHTHTLSFTA